MTTNKGLGVQYLITFPLTFSLSAMQRSSRKTESTLIRSIFQQLEALPLFLRVLGHRHIEGAYGMLLRVIIPWQQTI